MDDFFSILDRAKKDVEEKQRQAKRAEEAAARQQAAASASARVAVVAANAASRFDARERGRVLESAKALRTEGAGSIILKPASEQEMKASSAAGAKLSAALQRAAGLSGRLLTLLSVLEHAHTIGVPGAAHACMPTALMASALAQGVPLSEVAVAAVEDDLSTVDEDGGMALRQRLVSDVEAKLPADASMAAAWLAQVPEEVRPGIQHLLESLRRAGESLRGDPVAAAAASLRKGKGQLPDTYLDPADAVAAVAARHRELGRLPILFVYGATDMEGGGLAAQLVAPESTLARVRSDQQQGAATVFGPGEAVVVYLGCGHASAVSMGGSTLEVQYLADTVEATQYMDAFSNCVVRLPDHLAALAADLEAAQTVPAWAAVAAGERPGVQLALGLVTPPRPAPAALPAAQRSPTPGSDRRLASIAAPAGRTSPRHEAARGLTAAAVQAVEASGRGRVPAALSAVVDAMGFTEVAYRSKRAHPSGTAPGGHDNSQKVPAPAGNAAVSPIAKKARTTDEVLFDASSPAISINSSADVETDGSGDEDIEDQMPTDIYQKLQGRLSNVAVDPATAVTLCGTKRRAAYWNEQRLEAVRGGREAIAYHAIDHNYSTNTVRQCVKQDLVELGPDDDVYEDVEPDAADDGGGEPLA
eukprot:XP_001701372.1 predicted protein [Chlamydomonas reinhardtii]